MDLSILQETAKFGGAAVVAVIAALFAINKEIRRIKQELERDYTKLLFEKRLVSYSELHYLISTFLKKLRYAPVQCSDIKKFVQEFDDLDSKHSFMFVESTSHYAWFLQRYLHQLLGQEAWGDIYKQLPELIEYVAYFEYILRAELGTFDKEVAGRYPDISATLNKLKKAVANDRVK